MDTTATGTGFDLTTSDGLRLRGRRWCATTAPPTGRALLIHGVGEHSGRYDEVAGVMTKLGMDVVSYDQRGFGQSDGPRGVIPHFTTLVDDAAMVFDVVRAECGTGDVPFLVAHSMGGTVAAYAVMTGAIAPRALALSSPAIRPRVTELEEHLLRLLLETQPDKQFDSLIFPFKVTRDRDVQKMIEHDPLMHRQVTPRLILSVLDMGAAVIAHPERFTIPMLFLIAGSDLVVDQQQTTSFAASLQPQLVTKHVYRRLFHEVFNELPGDRRQVLADFRDWLQTQLAVVR